MSGQTVREYLAHLWRKYQEIKGRSDRSVVIDEICRNLSVHRKSAVRLMNKGSPPKKGRGPSKSRRPRYSQKSKDLLAALWKTCGYINSKRLKAAAPDWLPFWEDKSVTQETKDEVIQMSSSSIERFLKSEKAALRRRLNTGTRSHKKVVTQVPIRNLSFEAKNPGFGEMDTVMHCGDSLSGSFAKTLTFVDLDCGWVECEAMPDHQGLTVKKSLDEIEERLPFRLLGLYADGGLEFWNDDVISRFIKKDDREIEIDFGRGRPYKKNDQCHVEQKNFTHVRNYFGWDRISGKVAINYMNNIYRKEWRLLNNFFLPQTKLLQKERHGSQIKRKIDQGKTPFQRLMESPAVSEDTKRMLQLKKDSLNPIELRRKLTKKLRDFRRYLKHDFNQPFSGRFHDKV